jgi:Cd2+/Zn2+-exporting ATPase
MLTKLGMANYATVGQLWRDWVLRACTFLVISCPCAVVISIPLSFFAGLGGASKQGVLVKGSNYLETLSQVRVVAFDKTGTITKGNFAVTAVHKSPIDEAKLLEYAAHVEGFSSHPIAASIREAYGKHIDRSRVTDLEEISGHGISAKMDGTSVAVGNDKLMARLGIDYEPCDEHVGTVLHVALDGVYCGHIVISDEIKESSKAAMEALRKAGVEKTVMLTGDAEKVAAKVAAEVGLTDYRAQLLPADKVACVEELLKECAGNKRLAFVGDGINDAPVLSRADIGIAMGALGSDAAIEAADVVLMDDDPMKIAKAIRISRKCLGIVKQNIVLALGVKLICLLLAALGIANMWIAIIADVGVMIVAVLNAIRCLFVSKL